MDLRRPDHGARSRNARPPIENSNDLERGLSILVGAGFDPTTSLSMFQAMYTLVVGHVAFHYGPTDSEQKPIDYRALPADRFENIRRVDLEAYHSDDELALDAMLDGLAARL